MSCRRAERKSPPPGSSVPAKTRRCRRGWSPRRRDAGKSVLLAVHAVGIGAGEGWRNEHHGSRTTGHDACVNQAGAVRCGKHPDGRQDQACTLTRHRAATHPLSCPVALAVRAHDDERCAAAGDANASSTTKNGRSTRSRIRLTPFRSSEVTMLQRSPSRNTGVTPG